MTVYGLGRRSTPEPCVAACDRFIYLDLLSPEPELPTPAAAREEEPASRRPALERGLSSAISSTSKDDGWSNLAEVGSYLSKSHAAFDPHDYGHAKLGELARAQPYGSVEEWSIRPWRRQPWMPRAARDSDAWLCHVSIARWREAPRM